MTEEERLLVRRLRLRWAHYRRSEERLGEQKMQLDDLLSEMQKVGFTYRKLGQITGLTTQGAQQRVRTHRERCSV